MHKQEAIDALECYKRNTAHILGDNDEKVKTIETCIMLVREAEEAERWIPVTERLPAYGEDVLISIGGYCNVGYVVPVNEEERYNWYFSGWYHSPNDVTAWMPLPEPYKEDKA